MASNKGVLIALRLVLCAPVLPACYQVARFVASGVTMDPFILISKMIGVTARIGAAIALGALALLILRRMSAEPFINIDASTYGTILTAGIIGACTVLVEFIIAIWGGFKKILLAYLEAQVESRQKRKAALKNLQTARADFVETLRFLQARNLKRFLAPAPTKSELLYRMEQSFLIEIDDPNYGAYASETYYRVPDYVWDWMESEPAYRKMPLPQREPWLPMIRRTPYET